MADPKNDYASLKTPMKIFNDQGAPDFGVYAEPFARVNFEDANLTWRGITLPAAAARLRLKQWQHFALILPDLFVGFAVVDVGFMRKSWCHVVDRVSGEHFEHQRGGVMMEMGLAQELWNDRSYVHAKGYSIEIQNQLKLGQHQLELQIAAAKGKPAVSASLRCIHDLEVTQPLVVVLPVGAGRAMYSHKVALPLEGEVRVGDRRTSVQADQAFAILDIHKAHYPRHTWWRWATFAGHDRAGRSIAMNLTRNINTDDEHLNENAIWVDGQVQHLGRALFSFNPDQLMAPWQLQSEDHQVNLTFTPAGQRSENLRLGLVRSVFHQLHGEFKGELRFAGETLEIDSCFGVCEDHDSLW